MRSFILLFLFSLTVEATDQPRRTYYLHCFRPTHGMKLPPSNDRTPATPPQRLLSIKLQPPQEFDVQVGDRHHHLKGQIKYTRSGIHGAFEGSFGMSGHGFSGRIIPEQVFDPQLRGFASGISPFRCVLSTNRNVTPFLEAQKKLDAETLAKATRRTRSAR
ncbi:MAG: hypothetical protein ACPGVU_06090 [Limisphaerales bacterium]